MNSEKPNKPIPIKADDKYQPAHDETPTYDVDQILGKENTARIIMGDQSYYLRKTRQNKLLLTK